MTSGPTSDAAARANATGPDDPDQRWRRAGDALWRLVPGSLVALGSGEDDQPQLLTGPAVEAWSVLSQPHTADDLARALARRYAVDVAAIADDVHQLVADLAERRLIATVDPTEGAERRSADKP